MERWKDHFKTFLKFYKIDFKDYMLLSCHVRVSE